MGHIEREMRHKNELRNMFFLTFQLPEVIEAGVVQGHIQVMTNIVSQCVMFRYTVC